MQAKNLFDLIHIAKNTFIFLSFYWLLADPPGTFSDWFAVVFMLMFAAAGISYVISNLMGLVTLVLIIMSFFLPWYHYAQTEYTEIQETFHGVTTIVDGNSGTLSWSDTPFHNLETGYTIVLTANVFASIVQLVMVILELLLVLTPHFPMRFAYIAVLLIQSLG